MADGKKKAAPFETAFGGWVSSELGLEHELNDSAGSRRALEVSVRTAWRRNRSGDCAEGSVGQISLRIGEVCVI